MNAPHVTMAVPHGMRGGEQCPDERIGAPERDRRSPLRARGTLVWAVVVSVLAASTVAFGQGYTSFMFGIDTNSDLWQMELPSGTTSGTAAFKYSSPLSKGGANGLAYDEGRDQLFVVDKNSNNNLWWLASGSTTFTSLGNLSTYTSGSGKPGQVVSAAYYNDAYWFLGASPTGGNQLGKVSLSYDANDVPTIVSGTTFTIVGMPQTSSGGGDMVITGGTGAGSGKLYAYSAFAAGNFFTVDVTTAASGTVGGYSLIKHSSTGDPAGLQLAFSWDYATLYGTDGATGKWYTVDKSNGTLTQIPDFQTVSFNDLAGSAIGNATVPEPSTYAMALAGLACGGFSMWRRRTRC